MFKGYVFAVALGVCALVLCERAYANSEYTAEIDGGSVADFLEQAQGLFAAGSLDFNGTTGLTYRMTGSDELGDGAIQFFAKPAIHNFDNDGNAEYSSKIGVEYRFNF